MKNLKPRNAIVRMATPLSDDLFRLIFSRYPDNEWGTFARFGVRITEDSLIFTVHAIDAPQPGDLDETSWITEIQDQYTSRMLDLTETHPYAVGFIHSHPLSYGTGPSPSDYAMEDYFSNLLIPYIPDLPFISLIFSKNETGDFSATGRIFWNNQWHEVSNFFVDNKDIAIRSFAKSMPLNEDALKRLARLASQFSIDSAQKLAGSTVGVVGASGTGSPCIELLARAGLGKLIIVDPDVFEDSNLERIHGSEYEDAVKQTAKVVIAGRHIKNINPDCEVVLIKGRIPQSEVVNQLLHCNLILGCTDLYSARVALSDIAIRYLIPVLDVGVAMEGANGTITGQILQINRLFPNDPCVYCRNMIDSTLVMQELMTDEEREQRKAEAQKADQKGDDGGQYWKETPQLNTVGYLTTLAGSMVIAYSIGYLTGRFRMKCNRIELNLSEHGIQVVETNEEFDTECRCIQNRGSSDQDPTAILITPPGHWPSPMFIDI